MVIKPENMENVYETDEKSGKRLNLRHLLSDEQKPKNLRTFANATLDVGAEVEFHIHTGESETYYILSGSGMYNDNGTEVPVKSGDITFTASGEGHGLRNTGTEPLVFIALIIYD